jgi:multiple sugar transport system substrate-binding protein
MKRILVIGACILVLAALPVFAKGQPEPGKEAAVTSEPSGELTVSWWGAGTRNEKTLAVIKLFEQAFPKVKVNGVSLGFAQYWQKITVEATARTLPSVVQNQSRQMLTYTNQGVFAPLDDLIGQGKIDISKIGSGVLKTGQGTDGKMYMIPYGAAYFGFMYNKTLVDKAGLQPLPQLYTWQQFEDWLKEAKGKLPAGVYPLMQNGYNSDPFVAYMSALGYSLFDKNGQLGFPPSVLKDHWARWLAFAKEGITMPIDLAVQEQTTSMEQSYLVAGKVMVETAPGNQLPGAQKAASQINSGKMSMMMYPSGDKGIGGVLATNGFSIPTTCTGATREAAAAFINFFTNNPAAAKVFASDNGVVTNTDLLAAQISDPSTDPAVKEYLQMFEVISKHNPPLVLYTPGFTAVFSTLYPQIFQQVAFGKMTLDEGVQSFFDQAKKQLSN